MKQTDWFEALTRPAEPAQPAPDDLRSWNGSDPAQRFAVYRNNVLVSLSEALADTFPVVQALVGEACFHGLAHRYIRSHLPDSAVLARYGRHFPDFLACQPNLAALPYLAGLARLEMARIDARDAADTPALAAAQLAAALAEPEHLPSLQLILHPAVRIQTSAYAVVSLWAAHQVDDEVDDAPEVRLAALDPWQAENALISRPGLEVHVQQISTGHAQFIAALQQGQPLGNAVATAAQQAPDFDLAAALGLLIEQQLLTGLTQERMP